MKAYPKTTATISRDDNKLVIVRKPVFPTRREKFSVWFWRILLFVILTRMISGFLAANIDRELGEVFQVTVIIAAASRP